MSLPTQSRTIIHVSSAHPATDPRIFEKECTTLAEAGHSVTLIAVAPAATSTGRVQVRTVPRIRSRYRRMAFGPSVALTRALRRSPEVLHLHDPELIPPALLAKTILRSRVKVIYDSHEDLVEQISGKSYLSPRAQRVAGRVAGWFLRKADRHFDGIVGATPHITDGFSNPLRTTVKNLPQTALFAQVDGAALSSRRLVYVGAIGSTRGLHQMLEVAASLRDEGVTLHIAGVASEADRDLIARSPGVVDHGLLDRTEVSDLLASCAVGLAFFDPTPNNMNGRPTKLYEYMAAGLPVVCSDFALWREMVEVPGAGTTVDPLSVPSIITTLRGLLADSEARRRMSANGLDHVAAEFNWDTEGQNLLDLYDKVLGLQNVR